MLRLLLKSQWGIDWNSTLAAYYYYIITIPHIDSEWRESACRSLRTNIARPHTPHTHTDSHIPTRKSHFQLILIWCFLHSILFALSNITVFADNNLCIYLSMPNYGGSCYSYLNIYTTIQRFHAEALWMLVAATAVFVGCVWCSL